MSDSSTKSQITSAMKDAMRAKQKERLATIRLMLAEFKRIEVDQRKDVDESEALVILDKMLKQRRDSIEQFEKAGRDDLASQEKAEIAVIQEFMPEPLSEAEISDMIKAAVAESGAESMRDMGKVMAILKPQLQGRADLGKVSGAIKKQLAG
ncbi:MAG: GatB/YqeY domain-containing protein [Gammaproteobacteria bacterium]|nr:GatB/YqeY domain-containing protein [Gammaproteobacteria bacterium]